MGCWPTSAKCGAGRLMSSQPSPRPGGMRAPMQGAREHCADPGAGRRPGRSRAAAQPVALALESAGAIPDDSRRAAALAEITVIQLDAIAGCAPGMNGKPGQLGVQALSRAGQRGSRPWEPPRSLSPFATRPTPTGAGKACSASILILPHRFSPPLGYGKRRGDDGKEALQA